MGLDDEHKARYSPAAGSAEDLAARLLIVITSPSSADRWAGVSTRSASRTKRSDREDARTRIRRSCRRRCRDRREYPAPDVALYLTRSWQDPAAMGSLQGVPESSSNRYREGMMI